MGTVAQRPGVGVSQSCGCREMGQHLSHSGQTILLHLLPSLAKGLEAVFAGEVENAIFTVMSFVGIKNTLKDPYGEREKAW